MPPYLQCPACGNCARPHDWRATDPDGLRFTIACPGCDRTFESREVELRITADVSLPPPAGRAPDST